MQDVGNADVKSSEVVSVMNVQRCEESGDHTLDFTFVVRDATVSAIDIAITAYGHDVFHRQVTSGLQARGGLVRTLVPGGPQSESDSHQTLTSFAVSDDASQLAVVFDRCKAVFVYSLPGCDLLHSFGVGDLHGNFEFIQPVHVTSVPGTTHWLVCDNGGHRVIEVTNTGGLVTCYLVNMPTAAVSDGTSVVVARQPVALPNYSTLELYSNGHFVNAFDWYGKVSSLSIFPARYQLDTILPGLAVESHRGTVFLLNDGAVVLVNGEVTPPSNEREVTCLGTVATSLGHMASLEHHGNTVEVVVRDCASGGAVRRWQTASSFMKHAPPQLQATSCHLYVSDPSTGGIHVFA
jgi:YD repeat-containing protein